MTQITKGQLRQQLRKRLRHCSTRSEPLQNCLRQELARSAPDWVLTFVPRSDEVDIWPVLQKLCYQLAFAKVCGRELEFAPWNCGPLPDLSDLCKTSLWRKHPRWNLIEPNFPIVPLTGKKMILLCPGLGFFQQEGQIFRLGRGGGFYDRAIARMRRATLQSSAALQVWGLGYAVQWHPALPSVHEPGRDQLLDGLFLGGQFLHPLQKVRFSGAFPVKS